METDRCMLEDFIQCYRVNRQLWDSSLKDYQNKDRREEGYGQLLAVLQRMKPNATTGDVKRKINTLRCGYRRELRKIQLAQRSNEIYYPSIWWYDLVDFIRTETVVKEEKLDIPLPPDAAPYEEFIMTPKTRMAIEKPAVTVRRKKSKQSAGCDYGRAPAGGDTAVAAATDELLAKTWASKLQKLSHRQRLFAEKAINDILFEAELGTLERHSVQINESQESFVGKNERASFINTQASKPQVPEHFQSEW